MKGLTDYWDNTKLCSAYKGRYIVQIIYEQECRLILLASVRMI